MSSREVWIVSAPRTAIGTFGDALKDVRLADLATTAVRGALGRSTVSPGEVEHVVLGKVVPTEPRDANLSRVAAINAGFPTRLPPSMSTGFADQDCKPSCLRREPFC